MNDIPNPELVEEGNHLVVRIPLTFKRRGGRKEIISRGGLASERSQSCRANKPLVVAIARAHRWKELIEGGRYTTVGEMAAAMGMDMSYLARILRLSLLAPDIVEAIMLGDEPSGLSLARLLDIPPHWPEQRKKWGFPPR